VIADGTVAFRPPDETEITHEFPTAITHIRETQSAATARSLSVATRFPPVSPQARSGWW